MDCFGAPLSRFAGMVEAAKTVAMLPLAIPRAEVETGMFKKLDPIRRFRTKSERSSSPHSAPKYHVNCHASFRWISRVSN
jgi:hypothetical protein